MARYIDADKLRENLKTMAKYQEPYKQSTILGVVSTIENTPTADVAEVVRCRNCKSFIQSKEDECAGTCNHPMSGLSGRICKSDFCSYGERRTDNDL